MPIIGLTFNAFEARRNEGKLMPEVKINSSPFLKEIKEVTVPSINKKVLSIIFEFKTRYTPDIGEIKIDGDLLYLTENNAKILEKWKKETKLPDRDSIIVVNHLFKKCLLKSAMMAEDLQLPPPIPMPKIKPKEKK